MNRRLFGLFLFGYQILWITVLLIALPLLPVLMLIRKRRRTLFQRLGLQHLPESPEEANRPIWIHALSVGELISALKLIELIRQGAGRRPVFLSVSSLSARELAEERLAGKVDAIFYFPFDVFFAVDRLVRRIRPKTFILIETDLWPYFLWRIERTGAALYLVNTRLSPRTYSGYARVRAIIEPCLARFHAIIPQSENEILRFRDLGVRRATMPMCGNLKFEALSPEDARAQLAPIAAKIPFAEGAPIFIAVSTHPGEEKVFLQAASLLRRNHPELRFICAPRHPIRGPEVDKLARAAGFRSVLLSAARPRTPDSAPADLLVVDAIGHLAGLQSLASVAFIGGSLVTQGGQNPLEAAAFGVPVILGPDMTSFPDIAPALLDAGAAVTAHNAEEIAAEVARLLANPELAKRRGLAGRAFVEKNRETLSRVADLVLK